MRNDPVNQAGSRASTHDNARTVAFANGLLPWAAGLFDGEGCVSIARGAGRSGNPQCWLVCVIQMGDRDALEALREHWGGGLYAVAVTGNRRPMHSWRLASRAAASFLADIYPFLRTERRKRAVELALAFQAQKRNTGRRPDPSYLSAQDGFYAEMRRMNKTGAAA